MRERHDDTQEEEEEAERLRACVLVIGERKFLVHSYSMRGRSDRANLRIRLRDGMGWDHKRAAFLCI